MGTRKSLAVLVGALFVASAGSWIFLSRPQTELAGGDAAPVASQVRPAPQDPPLIEAVLSGESARLDQLLADHDPNLPGVHGRTALMHAASRGRTDLVEKLLAAGSDIDRTDDSGNTALFFFPPEDDSRVVELLVLHGAEVNHRNRADWTPLVGAAVAGHTGVVRFLIDNGALVEEAALVQAVFQDRLETAKILLEAGAPSNPKLRDGRTLLHRAAEKGQVAILQLLLDRGAESDAAAEKDSCCPGRTPLMEAAEKGRGAVIEALLKHGARPDRWDRKGWTPLHLAARGGHLEAVRRLLKGGASVDPAGRDESGATPLLLAVTGGFSKVAEMLLKNGANPNSRNRHQVTPLMAAAFTGHPEIARMLLNRKADLEAFNQDGNTALLMAVFRQKPEMVKLLLEAGARIDVEARVKGFGTAAPLMLAVGRGDLKIAEMLLQRGAPVDAANDLEELGRLTPLMAAAWRGDGDMVDLLLRRGADPRCSDEDGQTAADWAEQGGHSELAARLREAPAKPD